MVELNPIPDGVDRKFRLARMWSNREIIQFASLFSGDVVNVSAGEDIDKEGHHYIDYFENSSRYLLTNYGPGLHRGFRGTENEIQLDLCESLPSNLERQFDVVFNHTTLEHVLNADLAMENLCRMSRDVVMLVVPFLQVQHETSGYRDYWRFTPTLLNSWFEKHGLSVIYESANTDTNASIYIFQIAARDPSRWSDKIPMARIEQPLGNSLGEVPNDSNDTEAKKKRWLDKLRPGGGETQLD